MKQKPKVNTSENNKEKNYVNRRHQLKTTIVYYNCPQVLLSIRKPKGLFFRNVPQVIKKKKESVELCLLLNHLSSQLETYNYVTNNIKELSVLHFVVRVFFLFTFPHKYFIHISMKFGSRSRICECVNLCACLYVISLPICILLLFITHSLCGDQTLQ